MHVLDNLAAQLTDLQFRNIVKRKRLVALFVLTLYQVTTNLGLATPFVR